MSPLEHTAKLTLLMKQLRSRLTRLQDEADMAVGDLRELRLELKALEGEETKK